MLLVSILMQNMCCLYKENTLHGLQPPLRMPESCKASFGSCKVAKVSA